MPCFIKFKNHERKLFFNKLKENINTSWEKFYPQFNISRTMFFNYLSGRYNIPEILFYKWNKITKINMKNLERIKRPKYTIKKIPNVKMDEKLAEIFGILNGDGHISHFNNEICVVVDSREENYLNYLKKLFEEKFGISFTFFKELNRIKLRTYSVLLSNILTKDYGLPKGNKLGKLRIPKQILQRKIWIISYLRGLFDTDGSLYLRRRKEMVVNIKSADKNFLNEIKRALEKIEFHPSVSNKNLNLYRKSEIQKFFQVIEPANSKHLKKFKIYSNS